MTNLLNNMQIKYNPVTNELCFLGIDFESKIEVKRVEGDIMYFKVCAGTHWAGVGQQDYHSPEHYVIQFNGHPDARCKHVLLHAESNARNWREIKADFNHAALAFSLNVNSETSRALIRKYANEKNI